MGIPKSSGGHGNLFTGTGYVRSSAPPAGLATANFAGLRPEQDRRDLSNPDLIEVGGTRLQVDFGSLFRAQYATPASRGGVLREGVYARIWHQDGKILRIDLRR